MEAAMNKSNVLGIWFLKLADIFPMLRRPELERELREAKTRLDWQKKRMARVQHRYDALDRQCAALSNDAASLRARLYAAQQQADACKGALQALGAAAGTAEELKRIYGAVSPFLDAAGFTLFHAAQETTGIRLSAAFPYEDACGCFEFLDGFELLRYLKASEFGAVDWGPAPGSDSRKAILREVDEFTRRTGNLSGRCISGRWSDWGCGCWFSRISPYDPLCSSSSACCTAHFCALDEPK